MRLPLLLLALFVVPALAEAGVDFKCDSVKYEDQMAGWLRFGFAGRNGQVQIEYWNGYPPSAEVEADLDNGTTTKKKESKYVSEADRHTGKVAAVTLPEGFLSMDKFVAKFEVSDKATEDGKQKRSNYDMSCIRH